MISLALLLAWSLTATPPLLTHPFLTLDTSGLFRAGTVRWVQPFPEFANFNLLSENF